MSSMDTKTTWDGAPISPDPPFGVSIIVYRQNDNDYEFLILHRAHNGPEYEGDWAWTPPSGSRYPGEAVTDCARRELLEETGLSLTITPTEYGSEQWHVYVAEARMHDIVRLDEEHDRYEWTPMAIAVHRCLPDVVGRSLAAVGREMDLL